MGVIEMRIKYTLATISNLLEGEGFLKFENGSVFEGGGTYKGHEYFVILNMDHIRCGYVFIPKYHYYVDEEHVKELNVYGGITYFEESHLFVESSRVEFCLGFYSGHTYDLIDYERYGVHVPRVKRGFGDSSLKSYEFMESECKKLIDQIALK